MMMNDSSINDPGATPFERLNALRGAIRPNTPRENAGEEVNNHIHTIYSFSPYTPSMAAWKAREAGLAAAGSVDHDSIAAADEMLKACAYLGLGSVVGCELRASFRNTAFADRKLNNPDSVGNAYITLQGIGRGSFEELDSFLRPIRARRRDRTELMAAMLSEHLALAGLREIDFERDVAGVSKAEEGGGITERHLLAAAADILIEKYGRGVGLVEFLESGLAIEVPPSLAEFLSDSGNPHYRFDLVGLLKSALLARVFLQPCERECPPVERILELAHSINAIPAYAYLGDVGDSPTGDKKSEKFEDDFLDELFGELKSLGFRAIAYMPPRNTVEQLRRVRNLCGRHGFMEISGVDINSSRQSFNCPEVARPEYRHLIDTTWALVAHQALVAVDGDLGLFAEGNPLAGAQIGERLAIYARLGRGLDPFHPSASVREAVGALRKTEGVI